MIFSKLTIYAHEQSSLSVHFLYHYFYFLSLLVELATNLLPLLLFLKSTTEIEVRVRKSCCLLAHTQALQKKRF